MQGSAQTDASQGACSIPGKGLALNEDGQPGSPWANGCAATWFDYDGDSQLDLYVGNYFAPVDLWNLETTKGGSLSEWTDSRPLVYRAAPA